MKLQRIMLLTGLAVLTHASAAAQFSVRSLNGQYYVRQLNARGAKSAQGVMTFDGAGKYSFVGARLPGTPAPLENVTVNGDYTLTSGGQVSIKSLMNEERMQGGYANNIVFANGLSPSHSLLVAIPISQSASIATFSGNYRFVSLQFLDGTFTKARNAVFDVNSNGQGGLGNLSVTGQAANLNTIKTSQTINAATYTLAANGTGTLALPTTGNADSLLLSGNKTIYVSRDGNFVFGGSESGYDMILGVRALSGAASASTFQGLYYFGGVGLSTTVSNATNALVDATGISFSGSINATGGGKFLSHYAQLDDFLGVINYTSSSATANLSAEGVLERSSYRYLFGLGGQIFIGMGTANGYELDLGLKVPAFSGNGVFLNPVGIVNSASFAPHTNPIAPGELISLFGTNLAAQTMVAPGLPFPTTLGGVQVTVNGTLAPIYFVSPGQISVILPYSMSTTARASIQVTNGGSTSNVVEMDTARTSPGIFTLPPGGTGTGAILRQDYSVVSTTNPAKKGETIQIFLTGLGVVSPASEAGEAGPSGPLSLTVADVFVGIGGRFAPVPYRGLAPGLAGLYQINATIPMTVSSGNLDVNLFTNDGDHLQVTVPVQ